MTDMLETSINCLEEAPPPKKNSQTPNPKLLTKCHPPEMVCIYGIAPKGRTPLSVAIIIAKKNIIVIFICTDEKVFVTLHSISFR